MGVGWDVVRTSKRSPGAPLERRQNLKKVTRGVLERVGEQFEQGKSSCESEQGSVGSPERCFFMVSLRKKQVFEGPREGGAGG